MITFNHVYKTYDTSTHALRNLTLKINSHDFIFLTGESGAGKTTLFKLLTLQEKVTTGDLVFKEKNLAQFSSSEIAAYRKKIGIVFQDFKLISEINVFDNIALPLRIQKTNEKIIKEAVVQILKTFNLSHIEKQFPDHLSGGEKQRVAIARAVVHKPEYILADEPTGNLDKKNSDLIMSYFEALGDQGITVVIATHDENLLKRNEHRKNFRHLVLSAGELMVDSLK